MKKLLTIVFLTLLAGCNFFSDDPPENEPQSNIGKFNTGDFGTVTTETGESINLIPGAIPPDANGNPANVTFTIETGVSDPGHLGNGATFRSQLVKFGPEYFNFRWPLQLSIAYEQGADPNKLSVLHYDYGTEKWIIMPKSGMDAEKRLIYFNSLNLGVFALAELSQDYRSDCWWCDAGIRFRDASSDYFYTITVASVRNPKFDWQQSWLVNPGWIAASTGVRSNSPLEYTWGFLVMADYKFWVTRTKPGTYWELPVQETYSLPTPEYTLSEVNTCPQSATTFPDLNLCDPWVDINIPTGGTWVKGTPEGWAVPTVTYGTGDFQVTLNWVNNENHATDLDLHLYGPNNMHVYFGNQTSPDGSLQLDRDHYEDFGNATENIYSLKEMPKGNYEIKVDHFYGSPASFSVRIIKFGEIKNYTGSLQDGNETLIHSFTL